jgi:hypothetical protein
MNEKEYVPFGEEWKKSVMRLPKKDIMELFRCVAIEKQGLMRKIELLKRKETGSTVDICVCGTESHREITPRGDGLIYCSKCKKPY